MIRDRVMGKRREHAGCVGMSPLPSAVATARVPYKGASFLGLTRQSQLCFGITPPNIRIPADPPAPFQEPPCASRGSARTTMPPSGVGP
jgi:hypothetical protein